MLQAASVRSVGGGTIGTEMSLFVRRARRMVDVTLVHLGDQLAPELKAAGGAKVKDTPDNLTSGSC